MKRRVAPQRPFAIPHLILHDYASLPWPQHMWRRGPKAYPFNPGRMVRQHKRDCCPVDSLHGLNGEPPSMSARYLHRGADLGPPILT